MKLTKKLEEQIKIFVGSYNRNELSKETILELDKLVRIIKLNY